jgi:hypothetical protein
MRVESLEARLGRVRRQARTLIFPGTLGGAVKRLRTAQGGIADQVDKHGEHDRKDEVFLDTELIEVAEESK